MIKFICVVFLSAGLFCSCSSQSAGSATGGGATGPKSGNNLGVKGTAQKPFTLDDNTIKINANKTINEEFGNGLLPNEFVNGERINHNFSATYFSYDSAVVHQQEVQKLKMLAGFLESNQNLFLIIEGHCDERGSDEYNRALSERRALAIKDFLEKTAPSLNARINTIGFGEEKLAEQGTTESAHTKNRRAEFVIISKR